jgi:hypothetical protein
MFNFISWQTFVTVTALAVAGYYAITSLTLYRKEIARWIKSRVTPGVVTVGDDPAPVQSSQENFMGTPQDNLHVHGPRTSETFSEEIRTYGVNEEPEPVPSASSENLLIGSVADLLQEIKTVIKLIAEDRTGKTESEALFNALFLRYPHLQNTSYPLAISFYICEAAGDQFDYELTTDEVMSWWNNNL